MPAVRDADTEGTWSRFLETWQGHQNSNQAETDARTTMARDVKRRTHNDNQRFHAWHVYPLLQKKEAHHALTHPCFSRQIGVQGSQKGGLPGNCSSKGKCGGQHTGTSQSWRTAFQPLDVQQPGKRGSSCSAQTATIAARTSQRSPHWQGLQESDADVAVDVDCCGDSGSTSKICPLYPTVQKTCLKRSSRVNVAHPAVNSQEGMPAVLPTFAAKTGSQGSQVPPPVCCDS